MPGGQERAWPIQRGSHAQRNIGQITEIRGWQGALAERGKDKCAIKLLSCSR